MKTLEEITYEAGRHALADQEALVARLQQRTGTLLAAHALVASFLGARVIDAGGMTIAGWIALAALGSGLVVAATMLAPWDLRFAIDARDLYDHLYERAATEAPAGTLTWLAAAGCGYQSLRKQNIRKVRRMLRLSSTLAVLVVLQTSAWVRRLARWLDSSAWPPRDPLRPARSSRRRPRSACRGWTVSRRSPVPTRLPR